MDEEFKVDVEFAICEEGPHFPIMDSPRHASPLRRTRKLKLSLNDRSFIAGHRSIRRHPRSERTNERGVAIRLSRVRLSIIFTQLLTAIAVGI